MNASYPITIKIQPKHLEEFVNCEMGAHEDELTGPSPITTVSILERHINYIECQTVEEAAQVLDCCRYGTFKNFHSRVATRLDALLSNYEDINVVWMDYNKAQFEELGRLIVELGV